MLSMPAPQPQSALCAGWAAQPASSLAMANAGPPVRQIRNECMVWLQARLRELGFAVESWHGIPTLADCCGVMELEFATDPDSAGEPLLAGLWGGCSWAVAYMLSWVHPPPIQTSLKACFCGFPQVQIGCWLIQPWQQTPTTPPPVPHISHCLSLAQETMTWPFAGLWITRRW
jgi:hypothetical protein